MSDERAVVNAFNDYFDSSETRDTGISMRLKQARYTSQPCDALVQSGTLPDIAIEHKSFKTDNSGKLYFTQHFGWNTSENDELMLKSKKQIYRVAEFAVRSGYIGCLAIEVRRGVGKQRRIFMIPWNYVFSLFRDYENDVEGHLSGFSIGTMERLGYELEYESGEGFKVDKGLFVFLRENYFEEQIQCQECGKMYKDLRPHISISHDISCQDYKEKYNQKLIRKLTLMNDFVAKKKKEVIKTCLTCGKEFIVNEDNTNPSEYCSQSCAYESFSIEKESRDCENCGDQFETMPRSEKRFCSYKCSAEDTMSKRDLNLASNPNWRGGKSFEPYTSDFTEKLKEEIRNRDQRRCKICGKEEKEEIKDRSKKLQIHHIDYEKSNCKKENLISLCSVCHGYTNFKREEWEDILKGIIKIDKILIDVDVNLPRRIRTT